VLSGVAIHRGQLDLLTTVCVAFAGALCGIPLSSYLGRSGAISALDRYEPLQHWIGRHIPEARKWFERYGKWTLFFGYFIAGVRHFTALTAGLSGLPYRTFAMYAYPGALAWILSFISVGYFLGSQWDHIEPLLNEGILIAVAVVAAIALVVWLVRRRKTA